MSDNSQAGGGIPPDLTPNPNKTISDVDRDESQYDTLISELDQQQGENEIEYYIEDAEMPYQESGTYYVHNSNSPKATTGDTKILVKRKTRDRGKSIHPYNTTVNSTSTVDGKRSMTLPDSNAEKNNNTVLEVANMADHKQDVSSKERELNDKRPRKVLYYSENHIGPFAVYIENVSPNFSGSLNAIKVGGLLLNTWPDFDNKIIEIKPIGRNRVKVVFSDYLTANSLVRRSVELKAFSLEAFIPDFLVSRKGVIRHVSTELSDELLKKLIKPVNLHNEFIVDSVERLNRRRVDPVTGKTSYEPSQSILVSFKGQMLPKYVRINKVRCEVELYVQKVLICFRCYRFGHMAKQCKSSRRCVTCKKDHDPKIQPCNPADLNSESPSCLNCKGNHLASDLKNCPEFSRQKQIKVMMAQTNSSYREAAKSLPRQTYALIAKKNQQPMSQSTSINVSTPVIQFANNNNNNNGSKQNSLPNSSTTGISNKRARPSSPVKTINNNPLWQEHQKIITNYRPPNKPGGIFPQQNSTQGPSDGDRSDSSQNTNKHDIVFTVVEVVISLLNLFKHNSDVQESDILNIVKNKLGVVSNILLNINE